MFLLAIGDLIIKSLDKRSIRYEAVNKNAIKETENNLSYEQQEALSKNLGYKTTVLFTAKKMDWGLTA